MLPVRVMGNITYRRRKRLSGAQGSGGGVPTCGRDVPGRIRQEPTEGERAVCAGGRRAEGFRRLGALRVPANCKFWGSFQPWQGRAQTDSERPGRGIHGGQSEEGLDTQRKGDAGKGGGNAGIFVSW